jgi:hypothetical protein
MGGKTISMSATKIEAIKIQSSVYGAVIPLVYGVTRISGNLLWYGNFEAIPHIEPQPSSGKGGGVKINNQTYSYVADVMMGLCRGLITGVPRIWKAKELHFGGYPASAFVTVAETWNSVASPYTYTPSHNVSAVQLVQVRNTTIGGRFVVPYYTSLSTPDNYTFNGTVFKFNPSLAGETVRMTYTYLGPDANFQDALVELGLSFIPGGIGQAEWGALATIAANQRLNYSGLAMVVGQDYLLGDGGQIENHMFEVQAPLAYSISTSIADCDPADFLADILVNSSGGAGFPQTHLADLTNYSNYCRSAGLLFSPALTEQQTAIDVINTTMRATNSAAIWSEGQLKIVPFGDTAISGNGRSYTPDNTPIYDFIDPENPILIVEKAAADRYNHIRIEWLNRGDWDSQHHFFMGGYDVEVMEAKDQADIDANGLRSSDIIQMHWICDQTVARSVCQILMQRSLHIVNTYTFRLPWSFVLLEPMDLVTLTDATLGLDKYPVRITSIEEDNEGTITVEAEDFPLGVAHASLYGSPAGATTVLDRNVDPGDAVAPVIFEAPGELTQNGLEVWVAATGLGAHWAGCDVYASIDGWSHYRYMGRINGGSRYGTLSGSCGASGNIPVVINRGALYNGSAADAQALNTLCYIGGTEEFFAYQTANLTSALHYTLTGTVVRGQYGTTAASHSAGATFVRVDDMIAKSGPLDLGYVGREISIKLCSFNEYGGGLQGLEDVDPYTYTITGVRRYGNAGAAALLEIENVGDDGLLTVTEKIQVIKDRQILVDEHSNIDSTATTLGITTQKTDYDTYYTALINYLASLSPAYDDLTQDTTIVRATWNQAWENCYYYRQVLLNKISTEAAKRADWPTVTGKPALFRAVSKGFSDVSAPVSAGLYNGDTGASLYSAAYSYQLVRIRRSDGAITFNARYDIYTSGLTAANQLAADLNASDNTSIVVVFTYDEPQTNRLLGNLPAAMYRCGASSAVFGSSQFKFRAGLRAGGRLRDIQRRHRQFDQCVDRRRLLPLRGRSPRCHGHVLDAAESGRLRLHRGQ